MRSRRRLWSTTAASVAATLLMACTPASEQASPSPQATVTSPGATVSEPAAPTSPSTAPRSGSEAEVLPAAARPPRHGACYRLGFDDATAPTSQAQAVACSGPHTAVTYHVGRLDTVVDGHLLAVDSRLAQEQVKATCPRLLARFVGGSPRERRLSRLRAVWFSPTIAQSDQGASWFRCDVVALGASGRLAPLPRRVRGILDRPQGLDQVGLCGTAAPGSRGFERVICSRRHSWKALTTIDIPGGRSYPGVGTVRRAGEERCRDVVRRASRSPERFRYGWEWPTRDQWRGGQRYGFCWAPD